MTNPLKTLPTETIEMEQQFGVNFDGDGAG